jgi:hypothetical protein
MADPYLSNVVLLCSFDGADGSTALVDQSPVARTLTAVAPAQIDTAQFKFGTSSLLLSGAGYVTAADSADWDFGTGQFTIEGWFRFSVVPYGAVLVAQWFGGFAFYFETGDLYFRGWSGGINDTGRYTWAPTVNTWYHIAVDRDASNVARIYVNGAMVVKTTGYTANITGSSALLAIGSLAPGGFGTTYDLNGWIDDLRITKGVARYASDAGFTVPPALVSPAPTGRAKVWTGSAWVIKPTKVWSGSAWVTKPAKVWTGSAWV